MKKTSIICDLRITITHPNSVDMTKIFRGDKKKWKWINKQAFNQQ